MPTQTFSSPEAHVAANAHADLRIALLLRKPRATYRISSLVLPELKVQWGQGAGCTLTEGAVSPGSAVIFLPTQNAQAMRANGRRFDLQTFRLQLPSDELSLLSTEPHCWFSMSIPERVLAEWSGIDGMAKSPASRFLRIPQERAEEFQRAVALLGSIVEQSPDAFESNVAVKTTARKLTELVREVIWGLPTAKTQAGRQSIPRTQIVHEVMDSIESRDSEYLTVPDLAATAGVSERTLRAAFQDYFGMGPARFLRLRTLNLVHKALQVADPAGTTVTRVATQFGVWELGRLAHDYQALFGELPSATLRDAR
jgi:AraC family ethanolamine operon transcriptional activator